VNDEMILWNDAYMVFGITDLRGISDIPVFTAGDEALTAKPSNNIGLSVGKPVQSHIAEERPSSFKQRELSTTGIVTKMNWAAAENFASNVEINLNLKGSRRLDFIPAGKNTSVKL